jgi:hypothetical protein
VAACVARRWQIFETLSQHIRTTTGITAATIREKPIPLPELPTRKTELFAINDWSNDTTRAQLREKMALLDRHFTSLQGLTKAYIVERTFYPDSDVVRRPPACPRRVSSLERARRVQ